MSLLSALTGLTPPDPASTPPAVPLVPILKGKEDQEGSQRQGKLKEPLPVHVMDWV